MSYIERVKNERLELMEKLGSLNQFIATNEQKVDLNELVDLRMQSLIMFSYLEILDRRIRRAKAL